MQESTSAFSYRFYDKLGSLSISTVVFITEQDDRVIVKLNDERFEIPFFIPRQVDDRMYFEKQMEKMSLILIEYPLIFNHMPKKARSLIGMKESHLLGLVACESRHKIKTIHKTKPRLESPRRPPRCDCSRLCTTKGNTQDEKCQENQQKEQWQGA